MGESPAKPIVYLFAGHCMSIHGGGSTCAQITRAYVRAGYSVVYFSPDSPGLPVSTDGVTEVQTDRCDFGRFKYSLKGNDILHIALPCTEAYNLLQDFGGHALYHCRDNWDVWHKIRRSRNVWRWYVPGLEEKIIRDVDVSYAVSPTLQAYAKTTHVLSNAYDPTIFKWVDHTPPVRRVVMWGYSAGFADVDLIARVAKLTPQIDYVLIGDRQGSTPISARVPNVTEAGPKSIHELPAIAARSDVGLVIRNGPVAQYMCPIKQWEYLGSGLRFVSAGYDYPNSLYNPACAVSPTIDPAMIAETIMEVYNRIPTLTKEDAQEHTWDKRVEKILLDLGVLS